MMSQGAALARVAQEVAGAMSELDHHEGLTLEALEEELRVAQARLEAAQARYDRVKREQDEDEEEQPAANTVVEPPALGQVKERDADEASTATAATESHPASPSASEPEDVVSEPDEDGLGSQGEEQFIVEMPMHREHTAKGTIGTKNTSAKSDKELSRERWVAKKEAESRLRAATRKSRDRLRKAARDKKFQVCEEQDTSADASLAAPAVPRVNMLKPVEPAYDSDRVKFGARSLAGRLQSLRGRTNEAERKIALLHVLNGGKAHYYTSEPEEVLDDLVGRGLVDADLVVSLSSLLKMDPAKGPGVPLEQWLEHAKKIRNVTRKDDEPFVEEENQYLKWVERKNLAEAEVELDIAQTRLQELVDLSNALCGKEDDEDSEEPHVVLDAEPTADLDYADKLQSNHEPKQEESRGTKNTSALPKKVVSREKWLADRRKEIQLRESGKKAREARRAEARDRKLASVDV